MAVQASTSYSVVDNKLSWVLWMYSIIWMPMLVVMCSQAHAAGCFSRYSTAAAANAASTAATNAQPPPGGRLQQQWTAEPLAPEVHEQPWLSSRGGFSRHQKHGQHAMPQGHNVSTLDVASSIKAMRHLSSAAISKQPHNATDNVRKLRSSAKHCGGGGGDEQPGSCFHLQRSNEAGGELPTAAANKQFSRRLSSSRLSQVGSGGGSLAAQLISPAVQEGVDIWARVTDQLQRKSSMLGAKGSLKSSGSMKFMQPLIIDSHGGVELSVIRR